MGGNDAGFGEVAGAVYDLGPAGCHAGGSCQILRDGGLANGKRDDPAEEWKELEQRLTNAYEVTLTMMKPRSHLYVLEYPIPFAVPIGRCRDSIAIGRRNIGYINRFAGILDETIQKAAAAAISFAVRHQRSSRLHVLAWGTREASNTTTALLPNVAVPFNPHGLCGDRPVVQDFGPFSPNRTVSDSFHPTATGVLRAACVVARAVSAQDIVRAEYDLDEQGCPSD